MACAEQVPEHLKDAIQQVIRRYCPMVADGDTAKAVQRSDFDKATTRRDSESRLVVKTLDAIIKLCQCHAFDLKVTCNNDKVTKNY